MLDVVIPVYNEGRPLFPWLKKLSQYLAPDDQLVIVDASEGNDCEQLLAELISANAQLHYMRSQKGRAIQMNIGAEYLLSLRAEKTGLLKQSASSLLWFLHSDSGLSSEHLLYLRQLNDSVIWGRFDVELTPDLTLDHSLSNHSLAKLSLVKNAFPFAIISKLINLRSRFTQVMTGDQGIFIRSDIFQSLNGYADIPLMEDVEISKRLKRIAKADCDGPVLKTSARRWQQHGWIKTVLLMWQLRLKYWLGVSPEKLVKQYYG